MRTKFFIKDAFHRFAHIPDECRVVCKPTQKGSLIYFRFRYCIHEQPDKVVFRVVACITKSGLCHNRYLESTSQKIHILPMVLHESLSMWSDYEANVTPILAP